MSDPQRKKTYIDPQVQGALIRRLVLHWGFFFLVSGLLSIGLHVVSNPFTPLGTTLEQLWWTHGPFLLVVLFMLPVFVLDTIQISNRFAGPIYRLRKAIRDTAQGEPVRPLKFRDDDMWQDLAKDFNAMVDRLQHSKPENDETSEAPVELTEIA